MNNHWKKELKAWKRQFPFYKRILYFLGGYPPRHETLDDKKWQEWKSRFDTPEYDFKQHSGNTGKRER